MIPDLTWGLQRHGYGAVDLDRRRCPGESLAVQLLAETVQAFASRDYEVVSDPRADLTRIPTLPTDGVRIRL